MLVRLAIASLWNRKGSALLTLLAIAVSVFVLLGVELVRGQAKSSFYNTVSGIDLIVGARTGDINLLLYSVFHLGNATNNISWESYRQIADKPEVAWTIPIALGDSHKGYRVMGTSSDYFQHFRYGQKQPLAFAKGSAFADTFDLVLGSEVAKTLGYTLGDEVVLAHGLGRTSFSKHSDKPFTVVGILNATGTPVDQTLTVSLEGIEAIHLGWQNGVQLPRHLSAQQSPQHVDLTPESITAFMVGLQSKMATFSLQRQINGFQAEPLLAILPGVTLSQLWQLMSVMENTLRLISALVFFAALLGLAAMLLASIRERQQEIAVMRAIGAPPWFLLLLIEGEATLIALSGFVLASGALTATTALAAPLLAEKFSLFIDYALLAKPAAIVLALLLVSTVVIALIPGISAYRRALHQQLCR